MLNWTYERCQLTTLIPVHFKITWVTGMAPCTKARPTYSLNVECRLKWATSVFTQGCKHKQMKIQTIETVKNLGGGLMCSGTTHDRKRPTTQNMTGMSLAMEKKKHVLLHRGVTLLMITYMKDLIYKWHILQRHVYCINQQLEWLFLNLSFISGAQVSFLLLLASSLTLGKLIQKIANSRPV